MSRMLVTGADGSIGQGLVPVLREAGHEVLSTDLETMDVRWAGTTQQVVREFAPDVIYHLAGAKHAPAGEESPEQALLTNSVGTWNVLRACELYAPDAKMVLASTCKACDPETAYGASKLLAERMVLNAGGWVARFYNVPESSGNVFRLWESLPDDAALPVAPCWRFFISLDTVVSLLERIVNQPPGRYAAEPGGARFMPDIASALYPGRAQVRIRPRRGDRLREPLHAASETVASLPGGLLRIVGSHDQVPS